MAGFFDTLLSGFTDVAASFFRELESASEQTLIDQCSLQELSSTARFAEADMLFLADAEQRDGQLPLGAHEHAAASVNRMQEELTAKIEYLANVDSHDSSKHIFTVNPGQFRRAATDLAQLSESVKLPLPKTHNAGDVPDTKIKKCLDILYSALTRQLLNCGHQHVAMLKLTGFNDDVDRQMRFFFDLFVSSQFDPPPSWLQSRCTIVKSLKTVDPPGCQLIQDAEDLKQSLSLRLGEEPVGSLMRDKGVPISNQSSPTVSLGSLIVNGYFNLTNRSGIVDPQNRYFLPSEGAALCCTLARSLLHLSHGPWMRVSWESDRIFFLENASTGRLLDKGKPYLSWAVARDSSNESNSSQNRPDGEAEPSRNLSLINFARLLIEVYGHQRVLFDETKIDLHSELYRWINQISDPNAYLAMMACLGSEGTEAAQDTANPDRLQGFIHQHVLQRLEASRASYEKPHLQEFRTTTQPAPNTPPKRRSTLSSKSPYDGNEHDSPQNSSAAAEALGFVKSMKNFTDHYIDRSAQCTSPKLSWYLQAKIKIAIIDSGARKSDSLIMGAKRRGRLQGRNFLPGPPEQWDDTQGHGTHITRLILDMAPEADIYIAKVTTGQCIEQDMISCITNAVNWAVQRWDVDIISLSLVMPEKNDKLEEALSQAMDPAYDGGRRRIVFAAAGNTGGNAPMGWLATMPNIIAIHATDGLGAPANFNPTSLSGISFATLGQDIQSNWKEPDKRKPPKPIYLSGTSFATPIAAAIAANVLEWARWNLQLTEDRKKLLHSPGKMRLIFTKMMQIRLGVHYVQPWTLWKDGWVDGSGVKKPVGDVLAEVIAS